MSSLQTMTAPSVGHNRPPDPGIDVASNSSRSTSTTRTTNLTTTTSDAIPTSTGDNFPGREATHPVEGDAPVDSSVHSEIDSRIETLPVEEKRPETTAETPTQSHSAEGPLDLPQKAPAEMPDNAVSDEIMDEDKLVADKEGQKEEDSAQKGEQTTAEKGFSSVGNGITDNTFGEAEGRSTEMSTDNNKQLPTHDREKQAAATTLLVESLRNATATSQAGGPSSATPEWVPRTPLPEPLTDVSTPAAANEDISLPPVNRQAEDSNQHQDTETNGNAGDDIVAKQENDFTAVTKELQDPFASQSNALFGQIHDDSAATTKIPDMVTGVMEDPLSKSNHEHSALFASFDMDGGVKPSSDILQHPDLLSNAMLSNEISFSGLPDLSGYSNYDVAASTAGSEPRIQAFAKLEFDDGHFYVNTFSFVLGRDVRAARAAFQREVQVRQAMRPSRNKSSSGGNTSHTPNRVKRDGSAYMGSVVSDRGGIMGFDPDVPHHISQISRRSSVSSQPDSVLHATPAQLQANNTDYNALAMQSLYDSNVDAKPVDMLALLPSPDACPTIPIHPPATADGNSAGHKGISRKHVKIAYNFDKNLFEMEVMGRNGAFIGADWLAPGQVRPLHSGDYIQIGGVRIRFLLPDVPIGETGAERLDEPVSEHSNGAALTHDTTEAAAGDVDAMDEDSDDGSQDGANRTRVTKLVLKTKSQGDSGSADASVDNGESSQPKRRGPGRPPKDGIMSKRERAEIAREQKLAAKREANGGLSPPSSINRPKPSVPKQDSVEDPVAAPVAATPISVKPAEKKSIKRKQPDGSIADVLIESIEEHDQSQPLPEQLQTVAEYPKPPPPKKRKPSRSPSPDYPPESAYTPDQLAKPPYNYAVLIFDALTESRTPMTLKQIYRALKLKYPYFRFKCETEGWTSSVRHNLNGNRQLFEHAERDGKGWSWQLRAGASVEKEKKRRPSPPPPQSHIHQPSHQHYMPPPAHLYSNQGLQNQQFQFSALPSNTFNSASQTPAFQRPPTVPAPPPPRPAAQISTPNPFKGINLPPALMQRPASNYVSPYPCALPPEILQLQQQNQPNQNPDQRQPGSVPFQQHHQQPPPQFQQTQMPPPLTQQGNHHHQSHTQSHPSLPLQSQPLQNNSHQPHQPHQPHQNPPSNFAPNGQHYRPPSNPGNQHGHYTPQPNHGSSSSPSQQHAPQSFQASHQKNQSQQPYQQVPQQNLPQPVQPPPPSQSPPGSQFVSNHNNNNNGNDMHSLSEQESSLSFLERANKAIDDFEAVLMEDYDDKNYIREVLKSARARALGHADKSSFPDGEPKDEVVLLDVLRNLIGSLKDE